MQQLSATLNETLSCGTDLEIVNAARRSFDTQHSVLEPTDVGLIKYLARKGHWLPFRHPQLSFSCTAPVFVARQLGKHQVGLSWSEVSRRYKTERIAFWTPESWREKPVNAKQGTGPVLPESDLAAVNASAALRHINGLAEWYYNSMIKADIAPEQARAVLPQSMLVEWTWTGSLLAWLHVIKERTHPSAQTETRKWVVENIAPVVKARFPVTWEAMESFQNLEVPADAE